MLLASDSFAVFKGIVNMTKMWDIIKRGVRARKSAGFWDVGEKPVSQQELI